VTSAAVEPGPEAWQSRAPARATTRHLPSLTSLRWFAASAVFLSHAERLFSDTSLAPLFATIAPQGATGVSFFFILSGFVLAWSHRAGDTARQFYRRRFARVVPAYWAMCVVALVVPPLTYNPIESMQDLATRVLPITLLQSWVPSAPFYFGGNSVSWSLSDEVFFYALFPLVIGPLVAMSLRARTALLLGLLAVAMLVPLVFDNVWVTFVNPVFRLTEFLIGVCLCGLLVAGVRLRVPLTAAVAIATAAYLIAGLLPERLMLSAATVVPFALLIFAAAQADVAGCGARALHSAVLVRLGQWSYSFYLAHALVVSAFVRAADGRVDGAAGRLVVMLAAYAAAIAAAYALYAVVERPFERRIRRRATAVRRAEVAAPATTRG
jgi:peptidoglycan/LPS O-acetylase OafA/YrhL